MSAGRTKQSARGSNVQLPVVLIIDDVEEHFTAPREKLHGKARVICQFPNDVTLGDLNAANLVLVDLRLEHWPERDKQTTPALKPQDGLALIATLKSNLSKDPARTPTAFALHSGQLQILSGKLSPANREHALARMLDVDWVFGKGIRSNDFEIEVLSLARAVRALPHPWPDAKKSRDTLMTLLKLRKKQRWFLRAVKDVERAKPPQDVFAETTNGMAFIKWLLQDVLPFPTFLMDERYLAARLHVSPASFRQAIGELGSFGSILKKFEYTGILRDFAGRRWWRAGIEYWLWRETAGQPFDKTALLAVAEKLSSGLKVVDFARPVVELDEQFRPTDNLVDVADAIQITPDDWPSSADPAWISISHAKESPTMAARVSCQDRERLESLLGT
jgi:hypothetical protein